MTKNTTLPFCPHCKIVVAAAANRERPICFNCERTFIAKQNEDGTYSTSPLENNA